MRLTNKVIQSLTLPSGTSERTFFDADLHGFGLRLRAAGSRVWVIQYKIGGRNRRMVLGTPATLDPGAARDKAKDLLAAVRLGRDPAGEKQEQRAKAAETLGALLSRYLSRQRERLKPRSYAENERHLMTHCRPLHARPQPDAGEPVRVLRLAGA